jgi:hypothetical protein
MRRLLQIAAVGCILSACTAKDSQIQELQQQLRARDVEIDELRRQFGAAPQAAPPAAPAPPREKIPRTSGTAEEEEARALERALVRRGSAVLPQWTFQIEPEISYFYDQPGGGRRDTVIPAVTLRAGLPWASQAEVRVPYVAYDRQSGLGSSSGLSDIELAATKELIEERESVPDLLFELRWKTASGRTTGNLPTGTGNNTLQPSLTVVKSHDPLVLFASLLYTASLGSGPADVGNTVGGRLGGFLAATPDTTVVLDVNVNSSLANRLPEFDFNAARGRLVGVVELGADTAISRAVLLDVTTAIGFTAAAPNFRLTVSLPIRF